MNSSSTNELEEFETMLNLDVAFRETVDRLKPAVTRDINDECVFFGGGVVVFGVDEIKLLNLLLGAFDCFLAD
jgi:hypothetical protein